MVKGTPSLERLLDELGHALRALRRTPGFTLTVVLILGIGMASAMFTVFQRVLLQRTAGIGPATVLRAE